MSVVLFVKRWSGAHTRSLAETFTHQPVEQLSALRAIPDLAIYRPGDAIETAECWETILDRSEHPALLALSRQSMPLLRRDRSTSNLASRGGYILADAVGGERELSILSCGSELHLALAARSALQAEGIPTAVVSLPCQLIFDQQDDEYRSMVLGRTRARVAIEAAVQASWDKYLGLDGGFVAMHTFGASGKGTEVLKNFDITTDAVIRRSREVVARLKKTAA
ncbi:transketolase-like TK C-terminal-containing protein [Rhizobium jaguaris]|uniref:Transketolase n=1 Tax=Rhizobium jaguaris TaxID=1312183 RepID=A0A387FU21_9HYPH|nr:transketolase C-terminal domain-containing protein [Rhizobium jaguaris]AYG62169.1 hypothetical protein CCGE525_25360 [Rhizobium jaguaris]